jgi:hypothetical protein
MEGGENSARTSEIGDSATLQKPRSCPLPSRIDHGRVAAFVWDANKVKTRKS